MNRREFAEILYFNENDWEDEILYFNMKENDWEGIVWAAIFDYWCKGYLNICNVYELHGSIDKESTSIMIFELNSDIIIDILVEYGIDLSDDHRDWIKDGLDNSYYDKRYYICFYHEIDNSAVTKYAFFFNEIFNELDRATKYVGYQFDSYCEYDPVVIIKDNDDALRIYEFFKFEDYSEKEIERRKEVYILFKGKYGEELWNLMIEQAKTKDELCYVNKIVEEVQDELYEVKKEIKLLNQKILDYDHTCYLFENIISKIESFCKSMEDESINLGLKVEELKRKRYLMICGKEFLEEKLMKIENQKIKLNHKISKLKY